MVGGRARSVFARHVAARAVDYAWAYRSRLRAVGLPSDPWHLEGGTGTPVLLLPGVYETWHFLEAAGRRVHAAGHPVHVVPGFGRNVRPIGEMAALAERFILDRDLHDLAIVAHSKGGLIAKTLLASPVADRIRRIVAVNTPFGGSDYAHLVPIRTLREFVPTHDTIVSLGRDRVGNARIVSIYARWDPTVPNGSELEGAQNHVIESSGHFRILDRPDVLELIASAVDARPGVE